MPQLGAQAIIELIGVIVSGAGLGLNAYEASHQPKPSLRPNPQQVQQNKAQLASLFNRNDPNINEATSGGLSPESQANQIANLTGQQGNINQLIDFARAAFGGGGGGGPFSGGPPSGVPTVFPQGDIGRPPVGGPGQGSLVDPRIFGGVEA